jgi:pantoate--beta-alanine ligase
VSFGEASAGEASADAAARAAAGTTAVETTIAGLRSRLDAARSAGSTIALVPTMGSLHGGHLALVRYAREVADVVIVSIFVNPTQFGPDEDYDQYPRNLDADRHALAGLGVAAVFAPAVDEIYPAGPPHTQITAGAVGGTFEGRTRVAHFDGVLTVVAKLLDITQPHIVVLGEKDAQQVFLVQRMVRDLDIRTRVEVVDTVRDDDSLAMSSRNAYLDAPHRRAAQRIPRALDAALAVAEQGADAVVAAGVAVLTGEGGSEALAQAEGQAEAGGEGGAAAKGRAGTDIELDYFAVVHPETFLSVDNTHRGPARAIVAARVGTTRLIDTVLLYLR